MRRNQNMSNPNNLSQNNQQNNGEKYKNQPSPYDTNPICSLQPLHAQSNFIRNTPIYYNLQRKQNVRRQFCKNIQNHYKQVHLGLRNQQEKKKANFRLKVTTSMKKRCKQNHLPMPNSLLSTYYLKQQGENQKQRRAQAQMNIWYRERITQLQIYNSDYLQTLKSGIQTMLWNDQIHLNQKQAECKQDIDDKIEIYLQKMNMLYEKGTDKVKTCLD